MPRVPFCFADIAAECRVESGVHRLDGHRLGLRITVPEALRERYPYCGSAYGFLQELRREILDYGLVEFPGLPLNPQNYTLAQRAPQQHQYSSNPYLTDFCQQPHQDTPPYPTAFWLPAPRRYFATWVMGEDGVQRVMSALRRGASIDEVHQRLQAQSIAQGWGLLVNQQPGLLLIDNSSRNRLFHARSGNWQAQRAEPDFDTDTPMYAFNEVGLLNYIDVMDSRRDTGDRNADECEELRRFLDSEAPFV